MTTQSASAVTTQVVVAESWMVSAILNDDPEGTYSGNRVLIYAEDGASFEIQILNGGTINGTHLGQPITVRRVGYVKTQPSTVEEKYENRYVQFTGLDRPIIFHSQNPLDGDLDTSVSVTENGPFNLRSELVIVWNKYTPVVD